VGAPPFKIPNFDPLLVVFRCTGYSDLGDEDARVRGEPGLLRQERHEVRPPSILFISLDFLHLLVVIDLDLNMCILIMASQELC
jgi:hypothetical protein